MTKQTESLKLPDLPKPYWSINESFTKKQMIEYARQACQEVELVSKRYQELVNYVLAIATPPKAETQEPVAYYKKWDDAEKDLATQEPKSPTILARLPNGTTASNVYEAYEAGLKEGKAKTQEPVLVNATTHDGQTYKIEVSAPSRECNCKDKK